MSVWIIGLGRQRPAIEFRDILNASTIVARDGAQAEEWLRDSAWGFHDLSATFDLPSPSQALEGAVTTVKNYRDTGRAVCFLTPGAANIGDVIAERLCKAFDARMIPGVLETRLPLANCQVVDALSLAIAEESAPFDRGQLQLDATQHTTVTNLRGGSVVPLALQRLERIYAEPPDHQTADITIFESNGTFQATPSVAGLERIVAKLRSPEGCPWDREQTVESLLPQLAEELAEFQDAWSSQGYDAQFDELGDVLLHIIMIAQIAHEERRFDFGDVVRAISGKMVRRHPHVFSDVEIESMQELYAMWDDIKAQERADAT